MALLDLFLLSLSLAYFGWQLRQLLLGRASQRWQSTKGKVLRTWVDEQRHNHNGHVDFSYSAHVVYSYSVGGRQFESNGLIFEPTSGLTEDAVTQLLDGISEGVELDVFYDPKDWQRSVLIPGTSAGNIGGMVFSIAILVYVVWACYFSDANKTH